jgi:hypothetical protein
MTYEQGEMRLDAQVFRQIQGICFLREAPERAIGSDRRAGKWGLLRSSYRERIAHNKFRNNIGLRIALSGKFSKDPLHRLARNPWA